MTEPSSKGEGEAGGSFDDPAWVKWFKARQQWFKVTERALTAMFHMGSGGPLRTGLAITSVIGDVVKVCWPAMPPEAALQARGFTPIDSSMSRWIVGIMESEPYEIMAQDANSAVRTRAVLWEGCIAAVIADDMIPSAAHVAGDVESALETFRRVMWRKSSYLALSAERSRWSTTQGYRRFSLRPSPPPGPYVSDRPPDWYVQRIRNYPPGPRTIAFVGPSGCGKSVLAQHVALNLRPEARTLRVDSQTLGAVWADELLEVVKLTDPTVLLLDDVNLWDSQKSEMLLSLLEALRAPDCVVIVTVMTEAGGEGTPGSLSFPGMRPGRIDELWWIGRPEEKQRRAILSMFFDKLGMNVPKRTLKKIAGASVGLSGAYLQELVHRLYAQGVEEWKTELAQLRLAVPHSENNEAKVAG